MDVKNNNMTQKKMVLQHLRLSGSITSYTAIDHYGITRLAHYIYLLREDGHAIKTENVTAKNRFGNTVTYARYVMEKKVA